MKQTACILFSLTIFLLSCENTVDKNTDEMIENKKIELEKKYHIEILQEVDLLDLQKIDEILSKDPLALGQEVVIRLKQDPDRAFRSYQDIVPSLKTRANEMATASTTYLDRQVAVIATQINGEYNIYVSFAGYLPPTFEQIGIPVINVSGDILTYKIAGKIKRSDIPSSIHVRIDGIMNFSTKKGTATIHPIR